MPDNIYGPTDVIKHILMPESTDGTKPEHQIQINLRFETRSKSSFFWLGPISTRNLFYELTVKGFIESIETWSRRRDVIFFKTTESSHTANVLEVVQISRSASLLQCWMLELQLQINTKKERKNKKKKKKKKLEASK